MGQYQNICEQLFVAASASLVALLDGEGKELVRLGDVVGFDAEAVARSFTVMLAANAEFTSAFHEGERSNVHVALAAPGLILVVVFDSRSSLGLVRLRAKKAIEDLSRVAEPEPSGSGGYSGGAAAVAKR